ncbi:hypothetical protein Cantr_06767 [Candida viswanathii]|uniref:Uncharacterized protein n=1 Tax=Candida viswanathii TaxID=5486 RepID=A0A367XWF7_9ASCO|nr:hypothetical protein Cantr_06767 [Candida viswanathii]
MTSISTIETVLNQTTQDLHALDIPSLIDLPSHTTKSSPYITHFKLVQIQNTLAQLDKDLDKFHKNKLYHNLRTQLNAVYVSELDEKLYIVSQLISKYDAANSPAPPSSSAESEQDGSGRGAPEDVVVVKEEDLSSLRRRLLSSSSSRLDEKDTTKVNEYHESIQDDILNELTELTSSLKTSAVALSSRILGEDLSILNETNENIIKNSQLFRTIDENLNRYLMNKTGGKISIWFLLKCAVGLVLAFVVMLIFITIVPRIR